MGRTSQSSALSPLLASQSSCSHHKGIECVRANTPVGIFKPYLYFLQTATSWLLLGLDMYTLEAEVIMGGKSGKEAHRPWRQV